MIVSKHEALEVKSLKGFLSGNCVRLVSCDDGSNIGDCYIVALIGSRLLAINLCTGFHRTSELGSLFVKVDAEVVVSS